MEGKKRTERTYSESQGGKALQEIEGRAFEDGVGRVCLVGRGRGDGRTCANRGTGARACAKAEESLDFPPGRSATLLKNFYGPHPGQRMQILCVSAGG